MTDYSNLWVFWNNLTSSDMFYNEKWTSLYVHSQCSPRCQCDYCQSKINKLNRLLRWQWQQLTQSSLVHSNDFVFHQSMSCFHSVRACAFVFWVYNKYQKLNLPNGDSKWCWHQAQLTTISHWDLFCSVEWVPMIQFNRFNLAIASFFSRFFFIIKHNYRFVEHGANLIRKMFISK